MIWFDGLVEEAVQKALREKKIFIVYVEGEDEDSKRMVMTWNDKQVKECCTDEKCVAIKIMAGSVESDQFSKCYPLLCIPSTYLINQSGVPADIIPGYLDAHAFAQRIQHVLQQNSVPETREPETRISEDSVEGSASNVACNQGLEDESTNGAAALSNADKDDNFQDRVAKAESAIEKRRIEKVTTEFQDDKEKERKRRNEGQQLSIAKKNREEMESKKWIDEQAKAKAEAKAARDAVRLKLEQDKAEKRARFEKEKDDERIKRESRRRAKQAEKDENITEERNSTRIQLRLTNGSTLTKEFSSEAKLSELMDSVTRENILGNSKITLATVYPRRQFNESELDCTLRELNLVPSASLIVISRPQSNVTASSNYLLDFIKFVLSPIIALLVFLKAFLFGNADDAAEQESTSGVQGATNVQQQEKVRRSNTSSGYKREGNVYKFKQENDDDDDEEKKTWNGNSTQQM